MAKSAWIGLCALALLPLTTACAEGVKVEPQETVAGNGGSGDGGRRNDGGSRGDGGRNGDGGDGPSSPSSTSAKSSTGTSASCADGEVACSDGTTCVLATARCNGIEDCPDGGDEANCGEGGASSSSSSASEASSSAAESVASSSAASTGGGETCPGEYECGDGECIQSDYECDLYSDCDDGTDENTCDWICDPDYQDDGDCDCGCGAPDPACLSDSWLACDYCFGCAEGDCFYIDSDQNWVCGP